jgi:glycosyltransferase involved in cell wall biosynthesis
LPDEQSKHLRPVLDWKRSVRPVVEMDAHAALVTTFDRPALLEGCLKSLVGQFDRILIVDDGSQPGARDRNAAAASGAGVDYLDLGRNRGHACAFNIGIAMLLADLNVSWISKFDDDTELVAGGVHRLKAITHACGTAAHRTLYSGYAAPEHPVHCEQMFLGEKVLICRSCSGQHMHAHRSFWEGVLPLPTTYAGAPKSTGGVFPGQGCETDWWCANWAPRSAVKRGGFVHVLPGLVRNHGKGCSTWLAEQA